MDELLPHDNADLRRKLWVITLADMACLLLAFFVLVFSMSSVNREKWQNTVTAMSRQRTLTDAPVTTQPPAQHNIATVFRKRAINLDYLHAVLHDTLAADPHFKTAELTLLDDRLVISLPGDAVFAPGGTEVERGAERALFTLGGVLGNITNPVAVVGHAGTSAAVDGYASAWELAIGRAAAVANTLKRTGYTRDVTVLGAGDAGRARRVDIMILSGGG